jgi:hypothetical protein
MTVRLPPRSTDWPSSRAVHVLLATLVASVTSVVAWRQHGNSHPLPDWWLDAVVILSPAVSEAVAILIALDYMFSRDDEEFVSPRVVRFVQVILILSVITICFLLTQFNDWTWHLLWLASLFVVFVGWDLAMLTQVRTAADRQEIRSGSLSINCPTLVAISVVGCIASRLIDSAQQNVFVIGMVCFHLVVTGVGYFFVSFVPGVVSDAEVE